MGAVLLFFGCFQGFKHDFVTFGSYFGSFKRSFGECAAACHPHKSAFPMHIPQIFVIFFHIGAGGRAEIFIAECCFQLFTITALFRIPHGSCKKPGTERTPLIVGHSAHRMIFLGEESNHIAFGKNLDIVQVQKLIREGHQAVSAPYIIPDKDIFAYFLPGIKNIFHKFVCHFISGIGIGSAPADPQSNDLYCHIVIGFDVYWRLLTGNIGKDHQFHIGIILFQLFSHPVCKIDPAGRFHIAMFLYKCLTGRTSAHSSVPIPFGKGNIFGIGSHFQEVTASFYGFCDQLFIGKAEVNGYVTLDRINASAFLESKKVRFMFIHLCRDQSQHTMCPQRQTPFGAFPVFGIQIFFCHRAVSA